MSSFALLLRVLLSLSLILNGIGTAVAATHMLIEHVATSAHKLVAATPGIVATGSCHHQHGGMAVGARSVPAVTLDTAVSSMKSKHPAPACCKSSNRGCACLQATPAAMVALSLPGTVLNHGSAACAMKPGHASPALPLLIRPPIG